MHLESCSPTSSEVGATEETQPRCMPSTAVSAHDGKLKPLREGRACCDVEAWRWKRQKVHGRGGLRRGKNTLKAEPYEKSTIQPSPL